MPNAFTESFPHKFKNVFIFVLNVDSLLKFMFQMTEICEAAAAESCELAGLVLFSVLCRAASQNG